MRTKLLRIGLFLTACFTFLGPLVAGDIEQPPIRYSLSTPDNVITRLQKKVTAGDVVLDFDEDHGYLASVLKALDVPLSSQVFVFSKTSLQRQRIGPKTPRALYFNDDGYIGFSLRGDVLEVSAVDANLGTVFYTLDQQPAKKPQFTRQTDNCTLCHSSSQTQGYPGHLVRSVFPDDEGNPIFSMGTQRVDQTTPLADRWGGWYVTGTHGRQTHRGNVILSNQTKKPRASQEEPHNVTDLHSRFTVANYLTPHSDIVALMVLEHQTEMHNLITRAGFEVRQALYQQADIDHVLGRKTEGLSDSSVRRVQVACEPLVRHMLFKEEAMLTEKVAGTSTFAKEFAARGPKDKQGRSLRDFDLERRVFAHPCSYLIYSAAFDGLPTEAKGYIYRRLKDVLTSETPPAEYKHLTATDRKSVWEILRDTKPDLAAAK